jgi:hypothetical protein
MGMENSTIRTMRYIVRNCSIGDRIYAYSIAKAIDVEPQRMVRVFKRWAEPKNGFLEDKGRIPMPEGLRMGPPPRMYEVTALGLASMKSALSELASK